MKMGGGFTTPGNFLGESIEEPRRWGELEIDLLRIDSTLLWISESRVSPGWRKLPPTMIFYCPISDCRYLSVVISHELRLLIMNFC